MVFTDLDAILNGYKLPPKSKPSSVIEQLMIDDTLDDIIEEQPTVE